MNVDAARRRNRERVPRRPAECSQGGRQTASTWTDADQAELEVLLHEVTIGYAEHRQRCRACRPEPCPELETWRAHQATCRACEGDAPVTFGPPCERRERWLGHNRRGCVKCLPCRHLRAAIREVVEWRDARVLLSRAEALRAELRECEP
jgi:hypothetical protein